MFSYKGHMLGMQRSKEKAEQEVGGWKQSSWKYFAFKFMSE